jgi:hypothetical protein
MSDFHNLSDQAAATGSTNADSFECVIDERDRDPRKLNPGRDYDRDAESFGIPYQAASGQRRVIGEQQR